MKLKELSSAEIDSIYRLDPNSDRFRICPNCEKQHMVQHRGRDFCSDKCADDHYNNYRRLQKQAKSMLVETQQNIPILEQVIEPFAQTIENKAPPINCINEISINEKKLDSLNIDHVKGTVFHLETLINAGIDLSVNSGKGILYNIDPSLNCHFVQIGQYRIYRIEFSLFRIIKTNT